MKIQSLKAFWSIIQKCANIVQYNRIVLKVSEDLPTKWSATGPIHTVESVKYVHNWNRHINKYLEKWIVLPF